MRGTVPLLKGANVMDTVKVDSKGRLSIPREIREQLGIESGDVYFVEADSEHAVIHFAKAESPFGPIAQYAINEYHAGRTRSLREVAAEFGIDLNDE